MFDRPSPDCPLRGVAQQVVTSTEPSRPALKLELTVQGPWQEAPMTIPMDDWFDAAHKVIVEAFLDLTDKDAQTGLWGRMP